MSRGSSFSNFVEKNLGKFPHFVIYAVLEWVVIVLLFIDGFLAFICNEFARFFDLQIPCLLCTRIDHVLVQRSSNFYYNDSICDDHKRDVSSLAYCNVHKRLSDIRTMCQGCLISFATEKDPELDKYKSLVGKLKKDVEFFHEDDLKFQMKPLKKDDVEIVSGEKSGIIRCSCCGEPLKLKSSSKYKRNLSINAPTPSPRASLLGRREDERNMDLPPIQYTELKLVADSELELLEDEDASHADNPGRGDAKLSMVPLLPDMEEISEFAARTPSTRINKFFGIPLSDSAQTMSPRWASRSNRKQSIERSDFLMESKDARDGDGDIWTRLKRQIRLDRKALAALQMELDEERSASAVAANNAMAMISRLQEEKAAVQMEALQYQRMREEQAEYDQEALRMMKNMLFKREGEIKALELELDMYREKFGRVKRIDGEICEVDADDYQDKKSECGSISMSRGNHSEHEPPSMESAYDSSEDISTSSEA